MSFANFDYEAQKATPNDQSAAQNELDAIIQKTSRQLQTFGSLISQFDNQRKLVGSKRDNVQLRQTIDELVGNISDLGRAISVLLLNLSKLVNKKQDLLSELQITNKQVVIKERLVQEFNELYKRFQNFCRQYNEKKLSVPLRTAEVPEPTENTSLLQPQQQQQQVQLLEQEINQTELQYHMMLTEERDREITQVTEGIMEVNSIFKDLGELVHQQGEQLDTIEENIFQLQGNTQQADKELRKAHEYQKAKGKWSCILLVALCIFVLVIVLAVLS